MKKNYKLRIIIYGKNADNDIAYLFKTIDKYYRQDNKFSKYNIKPFTTKDTESNWEYYIFSGEINNDRNETIKLYLNEHYENENFLKAHDEMKRIVDAHSNDRDNDKLNAELSDLILKYRNFYDILVILVDRLFDQDSQLAFRFFQGFTKTRAEQPFIIFLTKKEKNPNIINLFQFVKNEFFDKRNVSAKKFPENDEEIDQLQKYFIKCMNYYHEVGNCGVINHSQTFNILICGPSGVGKSSFINQFLQEKIAKEGEGLPVTQQITCYFHPIYPISIYDTPGFENDNTVQFVRRTIEKFERDMEDARNHLDLIIYFSQLKVRTLFTLEQELLKHLIRQKKKMILVLNDHGNRGESQRARLKEVFENSIKQVINSMGKNEKSYEILNNIILINLLQSIEEDDEKDTMKIKQSFGMDILFKKIYDMFSEHKISFNEFENVSNVQAMKDIIKKYELLQHIQKIEDIYINIKINCSKLILSYGKFDCFIFIFRGRRRKELLKKINELNQGDKINNIDELYQKIENELEYKNNNNKKELVQEFFNSIRRFKGVFNTEGFNCDAYWYNEYTILVGFSYLKKFEKEYGQYDEKSKNFLREFSSSINNAIDGFLELSKEWENTYASLKAHESDKVWVNKYFIVKLPEI